MKRKKTPHPKRSKSPKKNDPQDDQPAEVDTGRFKTYSSTTICEKMPSLLAKFGIPLNSIGTSHISYHYNILSVNDRQPLSVFSAAKRIDEGVDKRHSKMGTMSHRN